MTLYNGATKSIALATGTTVELRMPHGSKEHLVALDPPVPYQIGFDEALVDAGTALPMDSKSAFTVDSPVNGVSMFVRQSSGGTVDVRWSYLYPTVR